MPFSSSPLRGDRRQAAVHNPNPRNNTRARVDPASSDDEHTDETYDGGASETSELDWQEQALIDALMAAPLAVLPAPFPEAPAPAPVPIVSRAALVNDDDDVATEIITVSSDAEVITISSDTE